MNTTELDTVKAEMAQPSQITWLRPNYKIVEDEDAFNVHVSLPGVDRDGLDVSIKNDELRIVATRNNDHTKDWKPIVQELQQGHFRLGLHLNVPIKESKIKAHIENGALDLQLPKADELKPRKIEIN